MKTRSGIKYSSPKNLVYEDNSIPPRIVQKSSISNINKFAIDLNILDYELILDNTLDFQSARPLDDYSVDELLKLPKKYLGETSYDKLMLIIRDDLFIIVIGIRDDIPIEIVIKCSEINYIGYIHPQTGMSQRLTKNKMMIISVFSGWKFKCDQIGCVTRAVFKIMPVNHK